MTTLGPLPRSFPSVEARVEADVAKFSLMKSFQGQFFYLYLRRREVRDRYGRLIEKYGGVLSSFMKFLS